MIPCLRQQRLLTHDLPYHEDASIYFTHLLSLPWAIWLDSARPYTQLGRYDILVAQPLTRFVCYGQQTTITHDDDHTTVHDDNPFNLLSRVIHKLAVPTLPPHVFICGLLGYFGYDLGRRLESIPIIAQACSSMPDMALGFYHWSIVIDHHHQTCQLNYLTTPSHGADHFESLKHRLYASRPVQSECRVVTPLAPTLSWSQYQRHFDAIQHHISQGDCYQINYAQHFQAQISGSDFSLYQQLRQHNPMPFSAYCQYDDYTLLCLSPERFVRLNDQTIETQPIKGTRPRHPEPSQDAALATMLCKSRKDRAENMMIVDLLRNDISKVAITGSVKTPKLCECTSYSSVHHLVSEVIGQLDLPYDALTLLAALFPGGSVTGAPKISAMHIIERLEPKRRHIFCGSIAYINHMGTMDSNITIRTLLREQQTLQLWAGGGIVVGSDCQSEYEETFDKIRHIQTVLSAMEQ